MNFYKECASILARLEEKKGSIKSLVGTVPEKDRKRAAALVIETLKYQSILLEIIQASDIQQEERKFLRDRNLTVLLVHDLLFSKGIQMGDGPVKQAVLKHKTRLNAELIKRQVQRGLTTKTDLAQTTEITGSSTRRWVRINTLLVSEQDVIRTLCEGDGFREIPFTENEITEKTFWRDPHIPSLCAFEPGVKLQSSRLFLEGKLILQDKASCFPAFILNPPAVSNTHVIDATAAPGNKTTHLSALMKGKGRITAFERDKKRFHTLEMMVKKAGATNVHAKNQDFLSVDPLDPDYANATHILLDPSCSGSGIVNRLDYLVNPENDANESEETQDRLDKLAAFQLKILLHAMKFPALQRLVYSTCSIHEKENEQVVTNALKNQQALPQFSVANKSSVVPSWHRRGLHSNELETESFIRCLPGDGMNGFFVACIERRGPSLVSSKKLKRKTEDIDQDPEDSLTTHEDTPTKKKSKKRRKKQKTVD